MTAAQRAQPVHGRRLSATVHAETRGGRLEQDLGLTLGARGKLVTADGRVAGGGPQVVVQTGGAVTLRAAR